MSDTALTAPTVPEAPKGPSPIAQAILSAPDDIWQRISAALGTKTRKEAASLVEIDEEAASTAASILSAESQTALSTPPSAPASSPSTPADTLYGRRKGSVGF